MDSSLDLLNEILENPDVEQRLDLLKRNFKRIHLGITLQELVAYPDDMIIKSFIFTKHLSDKNFHELGALINDDLISFLLEGERKFDFFLSKILLAVYLTFRFLRRETSLFLTLLQINKELNNEDTIAVLSNIVIDMLYREKKFEFIPNYVLNAINDPEQQAIHNYYKGRLHLVNGEYGKAYHNFQGAMILSSDEVFVRYVEKCLIACMLLRSELILLRTYNWTRKTKRYFELYECIKSGNVYLYDDIMQKNKSFYAEDGLHSVLLRLYENVIREGVRKIGLCYKRISIKDMALLLNMGKEDVEFLLDKCIKEGFISGFVEDEIFNSENLRKESVYIGDRIKDAITTFNYIKGMMRYPKTKPLTYDNIDKNSIAYDFNL